MLKNSILIDLPKITDERGHLSFLESSNHIPFNIERIYYIYGVPTNAVRAGHGHKALQQLFIPMSGSFDVHLDDGYEKKTFHLNQPWQGLYVPSMMWRDLTNFSSGSVCLVLASLPYDEKDYYREYQDFINAVKSK